MHAAHKAGMGVGLVLLIVFVAGVTYVGYNFYRHNAKPFRFHYFKDDDGEEDTPPPDRSWRSIANPVYESAPEPECALSNPLDVTAEDKNGEINGGSNDLLDS